MSLPFCFALPFCLVVSCFLSCSILFSILFYLIFYLVLSCFVWFCVAVLFPFAVFVLPCFSVLFCFAVCLSHRCNRTLVRLGPVGISRRLRSPFRWVSCMHAQIFGTWSTASFRFFLFAPATYSMEREASDSLHLLESQGPCVLGRCSSKTVLCLVLCVGGRNSTALCMSVDYGYHFVDHGKDLVCNRSSWLVMLRLMCRARCWLFEKEKKKDDDE